MKLYKKILLSSTVLALMSCGTENTENDVQQTETSSAEQAANMEISTMTDVLPDVPEGAQAVSLFGNALSMPAPSQKSLDNLAKAKANYDENPMDADNIIWYGRRVAYTGDFRRAIEIFSEGIAKHPEDSRMYRHRGHRYITVREFDRAISDYKIASNLITGQEDSIEPDGAPNPAGIPVSSRHGNIWYHLGLAYYLVHDWENALSAYQTGQNLGINDDNIVSTGHWIYMILRRMGREEEAAASLSNISKDMDVIENHAYHNLVLFYKGEIPEDEMLNPEQGSSQGAGVGYGIANWYLYNGNAEKAYALMEETIQANADGGYGYGWGAFGYIAAEVDLYAKDK